MNTTILGWTIGIIVLLGGAYLLVGHNTMTGDSMMQGDEQGMASSSNESMKGDGAMEGVDGDMMKKDEAMMRDDASMMSEKGSYEAYAPGKLALAEKGKVVLFFRASWCPTCKALDADIRSHLSSIPAGVTILDVDYDNSSALKQTYGVTYQHTLVQVRADGSMITKWSGSPTLATLVAQIQ